MQQTPVSWVAISRKLDAATLGGSAFQDGDPDSGAAELPGVHGLRPRRRQAFGDRRVVGHPVTAFAAGSVIAKRYSGDLATLRALATAGPPIHATGPDSRQAAELALQHRPDQRREQSLPRQLRPRLRRAAFQPIVCCPQAAGRCGVGAKSQMALPRRRRTAAGALTTEVRFSSSRRRSAGDRGEWTVLG
jgi:hypothetical protein